MDNKGKGSRKNQQEEGKKWIVPLNQNLHNIDGTTLREQNGGEQNKGFNFKNGVTTNKAYFTLALVNVNRDLEGRACP